MMSNQSDVSADIIIETNCIPNYTYHFVYFYHALGIPISKFESETQVSNIQYIHQHYQPNLAKILPLHHFDCISLTKLYPTSII